MDYFQHLNVLDVLKNEGSIPVSVFRYFLIIVRSKYFILYLYEFAKQIILLILDRTYVVKTVSSRF